MINSMALYLNLENTLISRLLFPQMMSKGKESYLKAIRSMDSRIRLVAPAKDWVMIAIANPEIIELIKKKKICILPTLFSHVLPDCFPETMELQFKLSSTILRKIFDKISWQGIIPENTVSSTIVDQARKFWDCVIFSVSHNNLRKLETGSYRLKDLDGKSIKLQIIANSSARMLYMRMFREKVSPIEVLSAMRNGDELKTCLFDFERPWSNIVYFPDARKSPARLDIWDTFHNFIKSETISEWDFEKSKKRRSLFLDHSDIRMWINKESEWLFEIQKNTTLKCAGRGDYSKSPPLSQQALCPRWYSQDSCKTTVFPHLTTEKMAWLISLVMLVR